ncbi:MAG: hypothetical protein AAGC53_12305 [Actinomycetota bacterium]
MRRFVPLVIAAVAVLATACTTVTPEELGVDTPSGIADDGPSSATPDDDGPSSTTTSTTTTTTTLPEVVDFTGAIAIGGLPGLVITDSAGELLATAPDDPLGQATQPTWSRDGDRAVALLPTPGGAQVVVRSTEETFVNEARRGYFFFSWSGDGQYIAALGPGPQGTTLDILTAQGALATQASLDTQSFYLAWEPDGDDLVVHRDGTLDLVRDPLDLSELESLGEPGQSFMAPAWIPGTREVVIVDDADDGRLIRLDVDTGDRIDLGPVGGEAGLTVSPDGSRLFLSHSGPNVEFSDDITISRPTGVPVQDDPDILAASEIVVLETGMRLPINNELSVWGEWSRDGAALLFLQPGPDGAIWRVLDEDGVREIARAQLTTTFFRNYVFFAWQYVESPRLWSPEGDAIVFAATETGVPGIYVQPLDGERVRISDGTVAFWAPELPGGARSPA